MALDSPMASIEIGHSLGIDTLWGVVGEAVLYLIGFFASLFLDRMAVYGKDLADKGEIEVDVQFGGGPD